MTTATRPTLGHRLAEKLTPSKGRRRATHDARRTVRPRPKRPTQLEAEAQRILEAMEVAYVERRLGESHMGRELLRLTDLRSKAGFKEDFARLTLHAARKDAARARAEHSRVCSELRYGEYDGAHFVLTTTEAALCKATRLHRQAVESRELCDAELKLLEQAAEQAR